MEVDFAMDRDPKIEFPPAVVRFSPKLKPLWLQALAGPEADLKRQAARTIALAHQRGMPDLSDTAPALEKVMDAPDQHPLVVLAAARALVALDARRQAPVLFKHSMADGLELAQVVEPALARWDYAPVRKVWLDRLSAPRTPRGLLLLAVRGLATVDEAKAAPGLCELALGPDVAPDIRLEAARALAKIETDGLVDHAHKLAQDKSPERIIDRLVAASLLRGHRGEAAEAVLLDLAVDPEPSVAAVALARLLEIDPALVIPIVENTITSEDPKVRHLGARALVARATPEGISLLGPMLDDRHVDVRRYVCRSLAKLAADPRLCERVLQEGNQMLASDRWRGLEQAAILVTRLDHKPAATRLVELLDFPRPEVYVTAAWGLRKLAVPATLDAMLDKAQRQTARMRTSRDRAVARQLRLLFEAFGHMKYTPSEPLLRKYIPVTSPFLPDIRAAAIWALGYLHAGSPQPDLVRLLSGRLADVFSEVPESDLVRETSAVSLGRMKAAGALPVLRRFGEGETVRSRVGYACGWAIHQITGEPLPKPVTVAISPMDWFLVPIE